MNPGYLFAALIWGSIGLGFFIYGKKQKSPVPLVCGILLMVASYFAKTPLTLSLFGIAIIAVIYVLKKVV
ncbi:amino acid transport protein [Candidatus Latescibacterota bacterium]